MIHIYGKHKNKACIKKVCIITIIKRDSCNLIHCFDIYVNKYFKKVLSVLQFNNVVSKN